MITASFLPTAVLGVRPKFYYKFCDVSSHYDVQTFFSGTKIWDQRHGHAKYWGIIFGTAFAVGIIIYFVGILYSWWTFKDLAEGLRPFGGCCSRLKEKRRMRATKKKAAKERATSTLAPSEYRNSNDSVPGSAQPRSRRLGFFKRNAGKVRDPSKITNNEREGRALNAAERGSMTGNELEMAIDGKME